MPSCARLHITTEPGGPLLAGQSRCEAIDLFVEVLKPLAQHAFDKGVLLLIEPQPGLLLETTISISRLPSALTPPRSA